MPSPDLSDYAAVRHYLYGLKHHGAKYGIDRMALLAESLGHPERAYPLIHVAGTNGKGSVCSMLEAIYRRGGLKTGLYTSPHLVRQGERIQVNREVLDETHIVDLVRELQVHAERLAEQDPDAHPSFFEFMTAMALLRFQRERVDLAILETGLGGRLDATNIVDPEIAVITSISLDHTEILGDTVGKIAFEKAGILKPGKPAVLGLLPPEAEAVIREQAAHRGCPVYSVRERFGEDLNAYPRTNLAGSFQRINAATAWLVTEVLQPAFPVDPAAREDALGAVYWPGRWQILDLVDRRLIIDATHNPEGCLMLKENLQALIEETGRHPPILVGTLGEFRARGLMETVAPFAGSLHLFEPHQPRRASYEVLEKWIPAHFAGPVFRETTRASMRFPASCSIGNPGDTLVATGSIYLIGEFLERLFHEVPLDQGILQDPV